MGTFSAYLGAHAVSEAFCSFSAEACAIKRELEEIHYCVTIKDLGMRVRKYESEPDYGADIEDTFKRFSQGAVKSYLGTYTESAGLDHVQAQILHCVARLYPDVFRRLDLFYGEFVHFIDDTVDAFEREIQFYLSWLECIDPLRKAGLRFCYPALSATDKELEARDVFDLALAQK